MEHRYQVNDPSRAASKAHIDGNEGRYEQQSAIYPQPSDKHNISLESAQRHPSSHAHVLHPSHHIQPSQTSLEPPDMHGIRPIKPLDLGFLPAASESQTSLLEAVVGPAVHIPQSAFKGPTPARQSPLRPRTDWDGSQPGSIEEPRVPSGSEGSRSYGTSTEREWDILSDVSLRLNEGEEDDEAVEELQKKVNKRRSNLPHLESQLAALEAKIKAAEEKLAKAQAAKGEPAVGSV